MSHGDDLVDDDDPTHVHEIAAMTHSPYCPTCGQRTLLGVSPEWLLTYFSGALMRRVLACLIEARREHRTVSLTDLCNFVYDNNPDYPDGPPINAPNLVAREITNKRFELIERGWLIVGPNTTGNGFALAPFERVRDQLL